MIDLDPKAKEIIDEYLYGPIIPIHYGSESCALSYFRNWCVDQYEKPQLVCLRNDRKYTTADREKAIEHMNRYFANEPRVYDIVFQDGYYVNYRNFDNPKIVFRYKCEKFFHNNIGTLATHACIAKYGSVKTALLSTVNWIALWNDFEEWFDMKRRQFMEKMELEAIKKTGVSLKTPTSHGGLANLLKVLTKTMEKQGASIQSIAEVQYSLCLQSGYKLPNCFLTDVAVALDAMEVDDE